MPPAGSSERPFVRNDLSGEAAAVVQSGTINGGVHFHAPTRPSLIARAIGDWDPFDLDVHRAITVADTSLPALPAYLRRDHDDELDAHLADVDRNTMVVLTGESSTGKTRALYEAVRRHKVLRDWPLVYPRTADDLAALAGRTVPGTVLWLNETQNHLSGTQAVTALRALLEDTGPVVVLGTLWPQYWSRFAADDHARNLLQHRVVRVRVADRFDGREAAKAKADGGTDPRLLIALATSGDNRRVIQTIAGGPALVERYEHPDDADQRYAAAIVSAALDARRLGYRSLLTSGLLANAAVGYLVGEDRVDTPGAWFEQGMTCAAKTGSHGITALIAKRVSPGAGPAEGYEPHDYLDQHGRVARRSAKIPDSLWEELVSHAQDPDDRFQLAGSAYARLLYRYADPLREGFETSGPYWSRMQVLATLTFHGRADVVLRLLDHVEAIDAMWYQLLTAVNRLADDGRTGEHRALLEALLKRKPRPSEVDRMMVAHFASLGLVDEALANYHPSLVDVPAGVDQLLATALAEAGRWDQALALLRRRPEWAYRWLADRFAIAGNTTGLRKLAATNCLEATAHLVADDLTHGRVDDALAGLAALGRAAHPLSADLVRLLVDWGQLEAVMALAEAKHPMGVEALVDGLFAAGQDDRAFLFLRNQPDRSELLVKHLVARCRWEEALELVRGDPSWAYRWIPEELAKVGNIDKVREAADGGNEHARLHLVDLLLARQSTEEALTVLRRFAATDDSVASRLAAVLGDLRRFAELRERAVTGDRHSGEQLVLLAHQGVLPDGDRLVRYGLNTDGTTV